MLSKPIIQINNVGASTAISLISLLNDYIMCLVNVCIPDQVIQGKNQNKC